VSAMKLTTKTNKMKTFKTLTIGTIVTYNDMANVNLKFVILDTIKTDFGMYVNVMNLETKNIEPMMHSTEIGNKWTI